MKFFEKNNNTPSPINHAMLNGLEMGVWFAASFILSAQQFAHPGLRFLSVFVEVYIIFCAYQAAQHYKTTECDGKISFIGAFRYIFYLFLCSSLIAALIRFVYLQWVDTSFLANYYDLFSEQIRQIAPQLITGENAGSLESFREMLTPIRFSVYSAFSDVLRGLFWGLILAPFVCRFNSRLFKKNSNNGGN